MSPVSRPARAAIVGAYVAVFWLALPAGLWCAARAMDAYFGWPHAPHWAGWIPFGLGVSLVFWSMLTLLRRGGGLPVSALPPPRLAVSGPYRRVRHPIYLGFWLAVMGAGVGLGSRALWTVVGPAFLPLLLIYALIEERGLRRRFGRHYRRYQRRVGFLTPRLSIYGPLKSVNVFRILPISASGRDHLPRRGPAVVVANHACYLDPAFVAFAARRQVHFMATAELYRKPKSRWVCERLGAVPLRRFRPDPSALREAETLLSEGRVVGLFPEGERSVLGRLLPPLPGAVDWLRTLAEQGCPIIPAGISGNYDVGPRWSDALRRRRVRVRLGPPLDLRGPDAGQVLFDGLAALLEHDPQPLDLTGLDRQKLSRLIWRCPRCLTEEKFDAAALRCAACGARATPTADGRLRDEDGRVCTLGEWAQPVWDAEESGPLTMRVEAIRSRHLYGPLRPLEFMDPGELRLDREGVHFGDLHLPLSDLFSVTTERADTLQVAAAEGMWQFKPRAGSAFRLKNALDRWKREA